MTQTATGGRTLALVNETFTGDLAISAISVAASARIKVVAWSLTVTGNTAACPVQIKSSSGVVYAASRVESHGTLAATGYGAQPTTIWESPSGMDIPIFGVGETLVIGGGATAGVLDGTITYVVLT